MIAEMQKVCNTVFAEVNYSAALDDEIVANVYISINITQSYYYERESVAT